MYSFNHDSLFSKFLDAKAKGCSSIMLTLLVSAEMACLLGIQNKIQAVCSAGLKILEKNNIQTIPETISCQSANKCNFGQKA